jgi:hypothetical protein
MNKDSKIYFRYNTHRIPDFLQLVLSLAGREPLISTESFKIVRLHKNVPACKTKNEIGIIWHGFVNYSYVNMVFT